MYQEERTIEVNQKEYNDLIENTILYKLMLEILFERARLSWNGESLRFDDETLGDLLEIAYPQRYKKTFERLKEEENDEQLDISEE